MNQFKVGQRVRCVSGYLPLALVEGGVYTVSRVDAGGFVYVETIDGCPWFSDRFEPVSPPSPVLADFKPGSRWRYTVEGTVSDAGPWLTVGFGHDVDISHSLTDNAGTFELLESAPDPEPEWDVCKDREGFLWKRVQDGTSPATEWAAPWQPFRYPSFSALVSARGPLTGYQKVGGDKG